MAGWSERLGLASAGLAATLHVAFFALESLLFTRPDVQARFRVGPGEASEVLRLFVLNQGFYNLFLALGVVAGLALWRRQPTVARTLVVYPCLCMVGAGVVLALSAGPELWGAASVQAGPPLVAAVRLARAPAP